MHRVLRLTLTPLVLVLCGAGSARTTAPPLQVASVQDLTFGTIFPGVVTTVQPTDPAAGQYTVTNGTGKTIQAQLVFALPSTVTSAASSTVPLNFPPASAGFTPTGSLADLVLFDPNVPFTVTISAKSTGRVFLGGSLQPNGGQSAGSYTAIIVLSAS